MVSLPHLPGAIGAPADADAAEGFSPFQRFHRAEWARLRADTPLTLSEEEARGLGGQNEPVSLREVVEIYLPLSRLLNLYVSASQALHQATTTFLGRASDKVPYIIGMAGSVAVGKSTTARLLRALLSRWPDHPRVAIVPTDGFLFPNRVLEERGLMRRKGFPESFDIPRLVRFLADLKSGQPRLEVPVYSHQTYDIVPDRVTPLERPDIVIVEGLNVLQTGLPSDWRRSRVFVSDFFDFMLYVDADADVIRQWYVERFMTFRNQALGNPRMFFYRFTQMTEDEVRDYAARIWAEINEVNLYENILPTKWRADLVLRKDPSHAVETVYLRKL
jgi:type I pantothenate kinase